jgi:hypothetical protein
MEGLVVGWEIRLEGQGTMGGKGGGSVDKEVRILRDCQDRRDNIGKEKEKG